MLNLSNGLSFLRAPLALLFLIDSVAVRIGAILLAMLTDSIDGYIARRCRVTSQFGAFLDPAMDKLFVSFALVIFLVEGQLTLWQAAAMISRDFFLLIFGIYLNLSGRWHAHSLRSIRWGKITTASQFIVLIGLTLHFHFPWYVYGAFILFGSMAFLELFRLKNLSPDKEKH